MTFAWLAAALALLMAGCGTTSPQNHASAGPTKAPAHLSRAVTRCITAWNASSNINARTLAGISSSGALVAIGSDGTCLVALGYANDPSGAYTFENVDSEGYQPLDDVNSGCGSDSCFGGGTSTSTLAFGTFVENEAAAKPNAEVGAGGALTMSSPAVSLAALQRSAGDASEAGSAGVGNSGDTGVGNSSSSTDQGEAAASQSSTGLPVGSAVSSCNSAVSAGEHTTCGFAINVYSAVQSAYGRTGAVPENVEAYSPTTKITYRLKCAIFSGDVGCFTKDGADAEFTESALTGPGSGSTITLTTPPDDGPADVKGPGTTCGLVNNVGPTFTNSSPGQGYGVEIVSGTVSCTRALQVVSAIYAELTQAPHPGALWMVDGQYVCTVASGVNGSANCQSTNGEVHFEATQLPLPPTPAQKAAQAAQARVSKAANAVLAHAGPSCPDAVSMKTGATVRAAPANSEMYYVGIQASGLKCAEAYQVISTARAVITTSDAGFRNGPPVHGGDGFVCHGDPSVSSGTESPEFRCAAGPKTILFGAPD